MNYPLRGSDALLAGFAYEQTVRQQALTLKKELIRQTLEDVGSWTRAVDDKWANAHPDLPFNSPIPREEVEQYRDRVRNEDYEWVVPSFERFLTPDPDDLNPLIDALAQMEAIFEGRADTSGSWVGASPALVRINDVRVEMDGWAGSFKNNFIDHFVTPLQNTLPNERELARLAREQLECTKVIYIRFRRSVLRLLEDGINATKALSQSACSSDELFKWGSIAMCVVGTVAGPIAVG